jgi:hypothetical protein
MPPAHLLHVMAERNGATPMPPRHRGNRLPSRRSSVPGFLRNTMKRGRTRGRCARQDPNADLPGCHADDEEENDRNLTRTPNRSLNQASAVRPSYSHTYYFCDHFFLRQFVNLLNSKCTKCYAANLRAHSTGSRFRPTNLVAHRLCP